MDDGAGGGSSHTVERLMGTEIWSDGKPAYDGTISQILALGGFKVKVMVKSGETRQAVVDLLGSGVLGLPWDPAEDQIRMHLSVNITKKTGKEREGVELEVATLGELDELVLTRRIVVSQIYGIYDPLGLLTPITI